MVYRAEAVLPCDIIHDSLVTHKYMGSIVAFLISKSVEPNEEQKEMTSGLSKVLSASAKIVSNKVVW